MFQPTRKWVNKVNFSSFTTQNLFQIRACVISAQKDLDVTTMFTYSHANTPLGQSERAYYLSYFINNNTAEQDISCPELHDGIKTCQNLAFLNRIFFPGGQITFLRFFSILRNNAELCLWLKKRNSKFITWAANR